MPWPKIATKVTSARPIISAEAVEAVRAGFRVALSRARIPGAPPIVRAGRAEHGGERADDLAPRSSRRRRRAAARRGRAAAAAARSRCRCASAPRETSAIASTSTASAVTVPYLAQRDGGSTEPSRTAAIGGTRVARRAGRMLANSVTSVPTRSETTTVRVGEDRRAVRQVDPDRDEQPVQQLRQPEAEEEADDGAEQADHERLDHDRPQDLAARGAERAQRRELAHPLSDRDRERVRDHEGADEERDAGEREQA